MGLSEKQLAAIDRARGRIAEKALVVERTYFEESFEFRFLPVISQPAMTIVGEVQKLAGNNDMLAEQLNHMLDFMDTMALPDTAILISELARSGIMSINDLVDLQQEVVTQVAGRPTSRSSSSESGSPSPGQSSTASAPAVA